MVRCKICGDDLCLECDSTEWCAGECGGYACSRHDGSRAECGCLICDACATKCPGCDEPVCLGCEGLTCPACEGPTHADCAIECAICGRETCAECKGRCGSCGSASACEICRAKTERSCFRCERELCGDCDVHSCGACVGAPAADEIAFLRWHWERETSKERAGRRYFRETGRENPLR